MSNQPDGLAGRVGRRLRRDELNASAMLGALQADPVAAEAPREDIYVGLVTRTIAFAIDAAIINVVAALTGVVIGLGLSILHIPSQADAIIAAILGALWVIWSLAYFCFFWSTTGETPGDRALGIRVIDSRTRQPVRPVQAAVRAAGVVLAAIPLLAGFIIMLWDDRRRCLQDRLARTVVIDTSPPASPTAQASPSSAAVGTPAPAGPAGSGRV